MAEQGVVRPNIYALPGLAWIARTCRVAGLDWRLGRVYFLAFLNPYMDNGKALEFRRWSAYGGGGWPTWW